jgi:hypothetical protein
MKGKHCNIIPHHHVFDTKVPNFNHYFFSYFVQMNKKLKFNIFFQNVHIFFLKFKKPIYLIKSAFEYSLFHTFEQQ